MCDDDTSLLYRDAGGAKRRLMDEAKRTLDCLQYMYDSTLGVVRRGQIDYVIEIAKQRYERRQRAYFTNTQRED